MFRAIKVIFIKIRRLPKQVSTDGGSSDGGSQGVPAFRKIFYHSFFLLFFTESKNFCSETVHYSRLEIMLHYKYPKIEYMSIFFMKTDEDLTSLRVDFQKILGKFFFSGN